MFFKKLIMLVLPLFLCDYMVAVDSAGVAETINHVINDSAKAVSAGAAKVAAKSASKSDLAKKALKKRYKEVFKVLDTTYMTYSLCVDFIHACQVINRYMQEGDKETISDLQVEEACKYVRGRIIFKDCLIKNARGEINSAGRPAVCEEFARMFALAGGSAEIGEITETFKRVYEQHVH